MFDSIKNWALLICVLILATIGNYWWHYNQMMQEKLEAAEDRKEQVLQDKAALEQRLKKNEEEEARLNQEIISKDGEIAAHKQEIADLIAAYNKERADMLGLTDSEEIVEQFKEAFELEEMLKNNSGALDKKGYTAMRLIKIPRIDAEGNMIMFGDKVYQTEVITIPVDWTKIMIETALKEATCNAQLAITEQIDQLRQDQLLMKSQIIEINKDNLEAYDEAYTKLLASFMESHKELVGLINSPPSPELGLNWWQILLGAAGGVALCAF